MEIIVITYVNSIIINKIMNLFIYLSNFFILFHLENKQLFYLIKHSIKQFFLDNIYLLLLCN
jgi:hypothetical protein